MAHQNPSSGNSAQAPDTKISDELSNKLETPSQDKAQAQSNEPAQDNTPDNAKYNALDKAQDQSKLQSQYSAQAQATNQVQAPLQAPTQAPASNQVQATAYAQSKVTPIAPTPVPNSLGAGLPPVSQDISAASAIPVVPAAPAALNHQVPSVQFGPQVPQMAYTNPGPVMPYGGPGGIPGAMGPNQSMDNRPFLVKSSDGRIMVRVPGSDSPTSQNHQYNYGTHNAVGYPGANQNFQAQPWSPAYRGQPGQSGQFGQAVQPGQSLQLGQAMQPGQEAVPPQIGPQATQYPFYNAPGDAVNPQNASGNVGNCVAAPMASVMAPGMASGMAANAGVNSSLCSVEMVANNRAVQGNPSANAGGQGAALGALGINSGMNASSASTGSDMGPSAIPNTSSSEGQGDRADGSSSSASGAEGTGGAGVAGGVEGAAGANSQSCASDFQPANGGALSGGGSGMGGYVGNGANFNHDGVGANYPAYGGGMSAYNNFNQPERWYDSLAVHILLVALISLLLLIPNIFFNLVLDDRQSNQEYAVSSMTSAWGGEQDIGDPEIVIPVSVPTEITQYGDGSSRSVEYKDRYIRAKTTNSNVTITSERRFKGNYEATLYTLDVKQEGEFDLKAAMEKFHSDSLMTIVYNKEVSLVFSVKDNKGIDEVKEILINGQPFEASPCDEYVGFEVRIPAQMVYEADKLEFSAHYLVRGSQSVNFYSSAQVSDIMFSSDGANPNFTGAYLPRERNVDLEKRSFTAHYYQNNLSTGQPMISGYLLTESHSRDNVITIELFEDADSYVLINRLTKYVLLFIAMTFVTVLAFEIISKRLVSLVQYVVIGVALILFYLVLLSLSEHISFTASYVLGALVLSSMISLYIKAMFNSKKHAVCLLIMLWAMYAVLFAIVHVEAYALLVGTILLVLMLGVVMYITRHLNQAHKQD